MSGLEAWLAGKVGKLAVYGLALAGVILIPVAAWQHVTINGWPFVGGGLRGEVAALDRGINAPVTGYVARLARAEGNSKALDGALGLCSASVERLGLEGKARTDEAQARLDRERARGEALSRRVGALLAAQPTTDDLCASAEAFIRENVR